jgi:hypothetical protein
MVRQSLDRLIPIVIACPVLTCLLLAQAPVTLQE